jgi:hypothetical protein
MSLLEQLWAYALLAGAAAMAMYTVLSWSRGWIRDDEEDTIIYRKDHPRSFAFMQLLQIVAIATLLFVGLGALHGWK